MKKNLINILKGRFLIDDAAAKNWRFIIFSTILAMVMIYSSHQAEKKIRQINALEKKAKEMRSEYVDLRKVLMKLKMESVIVGQVSTIGLLPSNEPPKKIKIIK